MNIRTSLNSTYLLLTGVVLIALVMVFTVFKPLFAANQAKQQANVASQQAYQKSAAFLDTIDRKKAELDANVPQERALDVALPVTGAVEDMTRIIQTASQDSGIVIKQLQNTSLESERNQAAATAAGNDSPLSSHIAPQTVLLDLSGSYAQTRTFLTDMSKAPRVANIAVLVMNREPSVPDQLNSQVTVEFYSYRAH